MSEVNLVKIEANFAYFDVTISANEVDTIFKDIFKYYSNHLTIPGFRKGKVPPKVIENRIGSQAILEVATDEVKEKAHRDAIKETKLKARGGELRWEEVGEIDRGEPVSLKFAAPIMPDVKLPDISGTELVFTPHMPEPSMKERMLDNLKKRFAVYNDLEESEAVQAGHQVVIAVESVYADTGEKSPFENSEVKYELGLTDNLPGFDDNIYGMKVGESRTFSYTMPEDFVDDRIAEKELKVTATLTKAEKVFLPELNEEFIKEKLGFESEDQLQTYTDNLINYEVASANEARKRELALEQMLAGAEVEISEDMIAPELDHRVEQDELRFRRQGVSLDEILQKQGRTIKEYRDEVEPTVRQEIKKELVIYKIAETNNIRVSDKDMYMAASRLAQRYQLKPNQVRELLKSKEFAVKTYEEIMTNKVLDFLYGQVKFIIEGEESEHEVADVESNEPIVEVETNIASEVNESGCSEPSVSEPDDDANGDSVKA